MFDQYREPLQKYLQSYLKTQQKKYSNVNGWSKDSLTRLSTFATSGKLLRGSFILFIADALTKNKTKDHTKILPAAAAVELFHSSILIHDDIIDRDSLRRGRKTIHTQYSDNAPSSTDAAHYGTSQAICTADAGFFLAFELLSSNPSTAKALSLFSQEITKTIFAEMEDVHFAMSPQFPTQQAIEKMYLYKTARYTFSLPFQVGAVIANANPKTRKQLEKLGETLGLLFQLKDDELGLFGNPQKTGKPVSSDLREGKKTLYMYLLLQKATVTERKTISTIFGNKRCSPQEITYIQRLIQYKGIDHLITKRMQELSNKAYTQINHLPLSQQHKQTLYTLNQYLLTRES